MSPRRPDWRAVTDEALRAPASLARTLAAMGFADRLCTVPRGAIAWWRPDYLAPGPKCPGHRAACATTNRNIRDAEVVAMLDPDHAVILVDTYSGEWRSADGSLRGDDLPSLGAIRWACRYGQAANRIARVIGLRAIPHAG